jgi:hypothetical protein
MTRIDSRSGGSKLGMISFPSRRDGSTLGLTGGNSISMDKVFDLSNDLDLELVSTQQVSVESASTTKVVGSQHVEGRLLPNFASINNIQSEPHTQKCAVYGKAYARKGLTVPTWSRNIDGNQLDVVVGKLHHTSDCDCKQQITTHNVQTGNISISQQAAALGLHQQQAFFVHSTQWDEPDIHTNNWKSWEWLTNVKYYWDNLRNYFNPKITTTFKKFIKFL